MVGSKWLCVALVVLAGCGRVTVDREYNMVRSETRCRTGRDVRWEDCEAKTQELVCAMLDKGLTRDEAVSIALLNNRHLQAELESLGIAKSDLVQAGLLTNPSLDFMWRLPLGLSSIEGSLLGALTDLWQLKLRKRVAAKELEATMKAVNQTIVETIAAAKMAYTQRQLATARVELQQEAVDEMEALRQRQTYRRGFGLESPYDIAQTGQMVARQKLDVIEHRQEEVIAEAELRYVLGFVNPECKLPEVEELVFHLMDLPDLGTLTDLALARNLEIQMQCAKVAEAARELRLQRARLIRRFDAGMAFDKDTDLPWGFGPGISVELPIFDHNQAAIARSYYGWRRAAKQLEEMRARIVRNLTESVAQYQAAAAQAAIYKKDLMPSVAAQVDYASRYAPTLQVAWPLEIMAQLDLISARNVYLGLVGKAMMSMVEIEAIVGGECVLPQ